VGNLKDSLEHLVKHVQYPTNKAGVIAACGEMSDLEATDRDWFNSTLPEGNYHAAGDVVNALIAKV
jgi:hypothetical protein